MTNPTNADYIAAINVMRHGTPPPEGYTLLVSQESDDDGFDAIVLGQHCDKTTYCCLPWSSTVQ